MCKFLKKKHMEKEMQPTPVVLPGKSHEQRSLLVYSPWGHEWVRHDLASIRSFFEGGQQPQESRGARQRPQSFWWQNQNCGGGLPAPRPLDPGLLPQICMWRTRISNRPEGFPGSSVVKSLPTTAGDTGDLGSTPELGRSHICHEQLRPWVTATEPALWSPGAGTTEPTPATTEARVL